MRWRTGCAPSVSWRRLDHRLLDARSGRDGSRPGRIRGNYGWGGGGCDYMFAPDPARAREGACRRLP